MYSTAHLIIIMINVNNYRIFDGVKFDEFNLRLVKV